MVNPATTPGNDSGNNTLNTIWLVVAPMLCAASIKPRSTSRSAVSTSRATNGAAAIVSGTTAAMVPMDDPTTSRVNGITATSRMINGVERTAFTTPPMTRFTARLRNTPSRSVRYSSTPSGSPKAAPTSPEMPTITSVSQNDWTNISNISLNMGHLLHHHTLFTQISNGLGHVRRFSCREHRQRAECLTLDLVDLAVEDVEIEFEAADCFRENWLVDAGAGEREPQQMTAAGFQTLGHAQLQRGRQLVRDHVANQRARDFVMRLHEDIDDIAFLYHAAGIEHRDAIADLLDHVHLMRDQHDRQAEFLVDLAQQIKDGACGFRIERGRGFVGEQHFGLAGKRPGDPHALLLAAADLGRITIFLRGQPDEFQQRQHGRLDLAALHADKLERQRDVVEHRARRQQVEVLEDHADVTAF